MGNSKQRRRRKRSNSQIAPARSPRPFLVREKGFVEPAPRYKARRREVKLPPKLFLFTLFVGVILYLGYQSSFAPQTESRSLAVSADLSFPLLAPKPEIGGELELRHTVRKGETLGTIAKRYGLPFPVAEQIQKSVKALGAEKENVSPSIRKGQTLSFFLTDDGQVSSYRTILGVGQELVVEFSENGEAKAQIEQLPSRIVERIVVGLIDQSFAAAASKAGVPYDAVDELVDLFSNRVSFHRDFRKGDRFSLIFQQEMLVDGTAVAAGPVLAAALQVGGDDLVAIRFTGSDGKTRFFDGKGDLLGNSFLRYPLKFSRISSHFNKSRFHPVLKRRRPHNGVDFAAATGTPVRSVADGVITFAGRKGGGGKTIKIRHSDRYSTAYLHLSRINKGIRKGAKVSRGQPIGAVGMTGLATGPHLHYSFYDRGKYVDPLKIKLPTVERLGKGSKIHRNYLSRVLYTLNHYQNVALENFYWE